jgi:arylsulfatase A-like enzyme
MKSALTMIFTLAMMGLSANIAFAADAPPNIIWFIGDDIGPKEFGCYGHPNIQTPNVDRLASQGVRYTNAFVTTSSCSPSRASMFTGKYPHATGAENLHDPLPSAQRILPQMLKAKNYFSAICGKFHLGNDTVPKFDVVDNKINHWSAILEKRPQDQPFFLAVSFHDAHRPFERGCVSPPTREQDIVVPAYLPDVPEARAEYAGFCDEIRRIDDVVGQVMARLDRDGIADNTLVLFFGDNGPPFPRAKTTLYDSGIATPLVVRWPAKIKTAFTTAAQFSTVDLVPTCLIAADIDVPNDVQGINLIDTFTDPTATGRQFVFAERNWHDFDDHSRGVRTPFFKYIRNALPGRALENSADSIVGPLFQKMRQMRDAGTLTQDQAIMFRSPRPNEELYALADDPNEFRNLAHDPAYAAVLNQLRKQLDGWIENTHDVSPSKALPDEFDLETGERIHPPHQANKKK